MATARRRLPRKFDERRTIGCTLGAEIHVTRSNLMRYGLGSECQIREFYPHSYSWRIVGAIPHSDSYSIAMITLERACDRSCAIEDVNIGVVPSDRQTLAHQIVLRVEERVWPLIDLWWQLDATSSPFGLPRAQRFTAGDAAQ